MINMENDVKKCYSWIPINIGYINFNYIIDSDNVDYIFDVGNYTLENTSIKKKIIIISKTHFSDLNTGISKIFDKEEIYPPHW